MRRSRKLMTKTPQRARANLLSSIWRSMSCSSSRADEEFETVKGCDGFALSTGLSRFVSSRAGAGACPCVRESVLNAGTAKTIKNAAQLIAIKARGLSLVLLAILLQRERRECKSYLTCEKRSRSTGDQQLARRFINFSSRHLRNSTVVDDAVAFFYGGKTVGGWAIKERDDRSLDGCRNGHRACVVGNED